MYELHLTRATGPGFAFVRDDDRTLGFTSKIGGVAIDITGATITCEIFAATGGSVVHTLPCNVVDGASGTWRLDWLPADGAVLLPATAINSKIYLYRIQRSLGGLIKTLLAGDIEVLPRPPARGN